MVGRAQTDDGREEDASHNVGSSAQTIHAANWIEPGLIQRYRRSPSGYRSTAVPPKRVFIRPLVRDPQARLTHPDYTHLQLTGDPNRMLNAEEMRALPLCFSEIKDPRRPQGRRHRLSVARGIVAGATLCGMSGYKSMADWAQGLGQAARERFGCRRENKRYVVPSEFVIRDCLVRVEPGTLDRGLNLWNQSWDSRQTAPWSIQVFPQCDE
ncbi:transposase family protein [Acidithiobacillus sp. HP-11]|uniref:transposase family protein n=1 Tax=Acidithiobacillus sp. HP-11 TaxID=2697656 RepID=UPI001D0D5A6B|nr:transposase family protein [Acidithiobacillus sp. HP-11]